MDPVIITVAGIGAELTRDQQPALPLTAEEIARDAAECEAVGAAVYHLHVRGPDGKPTMDVEVFRAAHDAIRAETNLIVQFTTGGAVSDSAEARIAPLALAPEMATLTTGSVNFGDEVFLNPLPLVERLYWRMKELGIVPEYEIFDAGMLATAERLFAQIEYAHHRHYDFVLGVPGALPPWPDAIDFLVAHLPPGASWSATGIGRSHLDVTAAALARGGHVRTGLEDVRYFEPGRLAASNAELIARVSAMARDTGREIAGPQRARSILLTH